MTPSDPSSRDYSLITRGAKLFGKVVSASTANLHRVGYLPADDAVNRVLDVPYAERGGKQSFDIYLPKLRDRTKPEPFVFFVHGGGFVIGDRKMGALMYQRLFSPHHTEDSFRRIERFVRSHVHADEVSGAGAASMARDVGLG